MVKGCVWLLEESLGPDDPALRSQPQAPAVFVFDEEKYRAQPPSFKRLFFIYESLVETFSRRQAPSEIRRGNVVREVFDFCRKHGAEEIHVTRSWCAEYTVYVEQLRANFVVVEYNPDEWISWAGKAPHTFREFWKAVASQALPEEEAHDETEWRRDPSWPK